jgi:APA family basic amino acid/polyamine antiporter
VSEEGSAHSLGLWDATAIVAGSMIGSGIFLVSAQIARLTGSPGWLLAVWALAGAMTVAAALSYGELAAMFPAAGGQYVYLREAFGELWAFLFGWTQLLVIQTGTIAAVAVAFARFLGVLVPAVSDHPLGGIAFVTPQRLVAIALLLGLTFVNTGGLQLGKLIQDGFTLAKAGVLLALVGLGLFALRAPAGNALGVTPFFGPLPLAMIGPAMVGALFSADAWNNITFTAGEVRNPKRNLPGALILGTGLTIALYLAVNVGYLAALPFEAIAHAPSDRVASTMVEHVVGPGAAVLVAIGILISTFGCVNGMVLAGARVSYAMAMDGLFFRKAGALNRSQVPGVALWMQGLWASLLCLTGTYSQLLDYVIFAVLIFYVLTISGLFKLRRTRPDHPRPYRAVGYPALPAIYLMAAAGVAVSLLLAPETRFQSLCGLACVLAGLPVFAVTLRERARSNGPIHRRST